MIGKNLHVIPHDKGWAVKDEGSRQIRSAFDNKQEAIDAARLLARRRKSSFVVYGLSGQPLLKTRAPSSIGDGAIRRVIRSGTAEDWRRTSGAPSKKSKKEAAGALRVGTAKDWRTSGAPSKKSKKAAEPLSVGTAKDWRRTSGAPSKKSKQEAAGTLRVGTAKDWRGPAIRKPITEKPVTKKQLIEKRVTKG